MGCNYLPLPLIPASGTSVSICRKWLESGFSTGLLPDTWNWGLRMRRGYRERFPPPPNSKETASQRSRMHHGTCVTHVPWCMSRSLTRGGGESVPDISGACATHHFTHLIRGPLRSLSVLYSLFCVATVDFCLAFKDTSDDSNWLTPCNNKVPQRHKVSHSSGEVNG